MDRFSFLHKIFKHVFSVSAPKYDLNVLFQTKWKQQLSIPLKRLKLITFSKWKRLNLNLTLVPNQKFVKCKIELAIYSN